MFGGQQTVGFLNNDLWEFDGRTWRPLPAGVARPTKRIHAFLSADEPGRRLVLYGGESGEVLGDLWTADLSAGRKPALQVDVAAATARFPATAVRGLRVRAWAAGTGDGPAGALLLGWRTVDGLLEGDGWMPLAQNAAAPARVASDGALEWRADGAQAAQAFLIGRDVRFSLQVRPRSGSAEDFTPATVVLDNAEVRLRYELPARD